MPKGWPAMGETAWSGLGPAQVAGRACVICTRRGGPEYGVRVGRAAAGTAVVACPGVCAARAARLGTASTTGVSAGGGEQR